MTPDRRHPNAHKRINRSAGSRRSFATNTARPGRRKWVSNICVPRTVQVALHSAASTLSQWWQSHFLASWQTRPPASYEIPHDHSR